jgi:hypothetical protein
MRIYRNMAEKRRGIERRSVDDRKGCGKHRGERNNGARGRGRIGE